MPTILKMQALLEDQLQIQLVYEAGGLKITRRTLSAKERAGDSAKMWIDEIEQGF